MASENRCPIEQVVELIGDKWSLLIIRDLLKGCRRFGELQKSMGSISPQTLSARLSRMENVGLIERQAYAEIPPRVEYSLTEKGCALVTIFEAIRHYAQEWLQPECQAETLGGCVRNFRRALGRDED